MHRINRSAARLTSVALIVLAIACGERPREKIWQGDVILGSQGFAVRPKKHLRVFGATIEVCFAPLAKEFGTFADSIILPGKKSVHPRVFLTTENGAVSELGNFIDSTIGPEHSGYRTAPVKILRPSFYVDRKRNSICMFQRDPARKGMTYSAIQLRTDLPLAITDVFWWSGDRRAFLP